MYASDKIIAATCEVFAMMVGMEPTAGEPRIERLKSFNDSVSGMLGLSGDFRAMVAVHCPSALAMHIAGEMLGMEITEVDADVRDAFGEITNMVAGGLKTAFAADGQSVDLSVPTTVAGSAYNLNCLSRAECVIVPFTFPEGEILVEFKYLANT